MDVDVDHVEVLLPRGFAPGERLTVRLRRWADDPAVEVSGRVRDVRPANGDGEQVASIAFDDLSLRTRAQIADLALWDARREDGQLVVVFRGRFDERTDFSPLDFSRDDNVIFDVAGVQRINSWGARAWIMFLRSLPDRLDYEFRNASVEFVKHCNMIADMLGRGVLNSFYAPYSCDECNTEVERVLVTRDLASDVMHRPPVFYCACGAEEILDDLPRRYFAFLSLSGRVVR